MVRLANSEAMRPSSTLVSLATSTADVHDITPAGRSSDPKCDADRILLLRHVRLAPFSRQAC